MPTGINARTVIDGDAWTLAASFDESRLPREVEISCEDGVCEVYVPACDGLAQWTPDEDLDGAPLIAGEKLARYAGNAAGGQIRSVYVRATQATVVIAVRTN